MLVNADLHIHSPHSIGVSKALSPAALLEACSLKGISVLGSGDALHPGWRAAWEEQEERGTILVVPTAEVEDIRRVHHLILMRDFAAFAELDETFHEKSTNLLTGGRPRIAAGGGEIARAVHACGGIIGPAHAFTPWTSLYAIVDRISGCYSEERIDFLELGLSADSSYGAAIRELDGIPFLTNSDAHSASLLRFGREFNRMELQRLDPGAVIEAIQRGSISMNVGLFPEEGKYNRTACSRCYTQYTVEEARMYRWRCPQDGGRITKGVYDRARELMDREQGPRPPYCHMVPLGEIIQKVLGTSSPATLRCRERYRSLVPALGTEIEILLERNITEIAETDTAVADAVDALRNGRVYLVPGGGGKYGSFSFLPPLAL